MGHNIMNNNAFASVKLPAWHKLGTVVEEAMTSEEAIINAKLDYQVEQSDVVYYDNLNQLRTVEGRKVNYNSKSGLPLGVVSDTYKIIQNREAFRFFDAIVGEGDAIFQTAGALGNGEIIFISAKLPDYIRVEGTDDVTERYLLLTTGHDGKNATQAMFTPIRVVCNNTLSAALRGGKNKVSIRHKGDTKYELEQAHKVLGISNQLTEELSSVFTRMSKVKINDNDIAKRLANQFLDEEEKKLIYQQGAKPYQVLSSRKNNEIEALLRFYNNGIGQDMETCKGTVYGMYNALNGYLTHKKNKDEARFKSLYFGQSGNRIDKFFNECVELI